MSYPQKKLKTPWDILIEIREEAWLCAKTACPDYFGSGRALASSVERFLAPALSFVTFLFAVEKKSKLPQSACEDEVISNKHKYRSTRGSKKILCPKCDIQWDI